MSTGGQGTKWRKNIPENFNRLSTAHECYRQTDRQTTDGQAMAYSEPALKTRQLTIKCKGERVIALKSNITLARLNLVGTHALGPYQQSRVDESLNFPVQLVKTLFIQCYTMTLMPY